MMAKKLVFWLFARRTFHSEQIALDADPTSVVSMLKLL